ncbi:MAG: glycosyltransferase [Mucinivorans sp.]
MMQGADFVFTGLQSWDMTFGSNARDIALEVAKHNRVLYVNSPRSMLSQSNAAAADDVQRSKVVRGVVPALRQMGNNLWVLDYPFTILPTNFLSDGLLFDIVNRYNNRRMYSFVKKILNSLHFSDYILFIDNDMYHSFYAKEYLNAALAIYYRRDNLSTGYWLRHSCRIEPLLCAKCDAVVANSKQLALAVQPYNPHTVDIGQGVCLDNYDPERNYDLPADMSSIPHPIIGYTGMLTTQRLDLDLVYTLAQSMSSYSFVLVGGQDEQCAAHELHNLKNVYFLGLKEFSTMAQYIASFDVCINPQLLNEVTVGNYPRKVDEYLALGKPVVATATDTMTLFRDYTWICQGVEQYRQAIEQALLTVDDGPKKSARVAFAHTHTWQNSVAKLYNVINQVQ